MDVLRFDVRDKYRITVSTPSIDNGWKRFSRRVEDAATYCDYASSNCGELYLLHYGKCESFPTMVAGCPGTRWAGQTTVLFEIYDYQFAVSFENLQKGTTPKVIHQLKGVVESFRFYPSNESGTKGVLVGTLNFLNSPGKFNFEFEYTDGEGRKENEKLEMYVASPKLDTKNDLEQITALINQEYENYVFDYLTMTFSSFRLEHTQNQNKIIWLSIFKSVIDGYFRAVRYIMSKPNNKPIRHTYHARAERIRHWERKEIERFKELGTDSDKHYFRHTVIEHTQNTRENRFVKYTLHVLGKKYNAIFNELRATFSDLSAEEKEALARYGRDFKKLEKSSFFNKVGEFEGFRQESTILQQRSGYAQIYKAWLMLKSGLDLVNGKTDIGLKKIWELYEIWCFLVMKRLIAKTLDINIEEEIEKPIEERRYRENVSEMLNTILRSDMTHIVEFDNKGNGDLIRLEYQHTYNRNTPEFKTHTTEQRPDIIVTITKKDGFVLTYLYDAKYRVQDDIADGQLDKDEDIDIADYPLPDAINQMHRYRDAIYYAMKEEERPTGKEIIGGYILFPGRTDGDAIYKRYFYKSIEKVNIGAFPLLPADAAHKEDVVLCNLLEKHLRNILLDNSAYEQIKDSIPQKGLQYQEAGNGNGVALVMMEKYEDKQKNFFDGKIAVPIKLTESGMSLLENQSNISYVLFHTRKKDENKHFFRVESLVRIMSKEEASKEGYYLVQSTAKRYLCVEINLDKELDSRRFDPSMENIPYDTSSERYDSQFASLYDLVNK